MSSGFNSSNKNKAYNQQEKNINTLPMLSLRIINQSFKSQTEENYIPKLQKLFDYFSKIYEWNNLKGTINLVLIDDPEIQELNKNYRDKNQPTDVLSFPYMDEEEIRKNQDEEFVIGEIFISKTRSIADAKELGLTLEQELNKLLVHGVLHILGYDHIDDNDFLEMQKKEDLILNSFYKENPVE